MPSNMAWTKTGQVLHCPLRPLSSPPLNSRLCDGRDASFQGNPVTFTSLRFLLLSCINWVLFILDSKESDMESLVNTTRSRDPGYSILRDNEAIAQTKNRVT